MSLTVDTTQTPSGPTGSSGGVAADWPAEVELVVSALEAAAGDAATANPYDDRRRHPRTRYRVAADLRLFSDTPGIPAWRLYTRDASARGIGFVTRERLPLGYGGVVQLPSPNGRPLEINCTLFRCRDIGNGWFEGALHFNREQWLFAPDAGGATGPVPPADG